MEIFSRLPLPIEKVMKVNEIAEMPTREKLCFL
jgi:hypothetical protein